MLCRDKAASAAAGGSPKGGNKVDRSQSLKDQKAVRINLVEGGRELPITIQDLRARQFKIGLERRDDERC